jgi:hypothetical protein
MVLGQESVNPVPLLDPGLDPSRRVRLVATFRAMERVESSFQASFRSRPDQNER